MPTLQTLLAKTYKWKQQWMRLNQSNVIEFLLKLIIVNDSHEREMLRLISQYLHDHNYSAIAKELENNSNVKMEDESVYDFKQAVLSGNYTAARSLVSARSDEPWSQKVLYLLWEQSYMEHIESGKRLEAVNILQKEMMTRIDREDETSRNRIHGLA